MPNPAEMTEEVLNSWNRCHGALYQLDQSDLLWNLREQDFLRYWSDVVGKVPVLWAEATTKGVELGILPGGIWLSLYGEIAEGQEASFASGIERFAKALGKTRLAIASDEFHFLPGIPIDEPAGTRLVQAFKENGFSTAECADFVGAPENKKSSGYIGSAIEESRNLGYALSPVENEKDKEELSAFLAREFSGRWFREWKVWNQRQDTSRAFWNLLRNEKGEVLGFSRLAVRGRHGSALSSWTPGAMRLPLDAQNEKRSTDSCLGPIGIAAAGRGHGAGKILLGLSLHELSLQGAKQTCIDWTNAYNYYTPLGFQVVRKYFSVWKDI